MENKPKIELESDLQHIALKPNWSFFVLGGGFLVLFAFTFQGRLSYLIAVCLAQLMFFYSIIYGKIKLKEPSRK